MVRKKEAYSVIALYAPQAVPLTPGIVDPVPSRNRLVSSLRLLSTRLLPRLLTLPSSSTTGYGKRVKHRSTQSLVPIGVSASTLRKALLSSKALLARPSTL